jgi:hypothetical protein
MAGLGGPRELGSRELAYRSISTLGAAVAPPPPVAAGARR